jgi:hypothetical protein
MEAIKKKKEIETDRSRRKRKMHKKEVMIGKNVFTLLTLRVGWVETLVLQVC